MYWEWKKILTERFLPHSRTSVGLDRINQILDNRDQILIISSEKKKNIGVIKLHLNELENDYS